MIDRVHHQGSQGRFDILSWLPTEILLFQMTCFRSCRESTSIFHSTEAGLMYTVWLATLYYLFEANWIFIQLNTLFKCFSFASHVGCGLCCNISGANQPL